MAKYVTTESGRVATATVLPLRSFVFTCCGRDCVLAATCNLIGQRRRRLSQRQLVKCNDLDLPARQMGVRTANCQSAACTGAGVGQLATSNNLIKQVAAPKSLRSPLHSLFLCLSLSFAPRSCVKRVPCSFLSASSLIVIDSDCDYDNCCPRQPALAVDKKAAKRVELEYYR